MSKLQNRPAPFSTDGSNAFARRGMKVRVPKIIEETLALNPDYPAPIQRALETLRADIENNGAIPMLDLPAPDYDEWASLFRPSLTWLNCEWFYAEVYAYRHVIQATRWWETGRDPFMPRKVEELESSALWQFLEKALSLEAVDREHQLAMQLQYALWGNRIDLSFAASLAHGSSWHADDLIADDTIPTVEHLLRRPGGTIHFIADNTGTELAADLAFADGLLNALQLAGQVIYHVKMHPTFVSDTTAQDVLLLLNRLQARGGAARALAERLRAAMFEGRLRVAPDLYWNSSRWLWDLPPRLARLFETAVLVILKGDLNYRRALGDAPWPAETPFADTVDYFPAPLLALRTLKSDVVVGLPSGLEAELDQTAPGWHGDGRRGQIQFASK